MRFSLSWLRVVFNPPVIIFIALILGSCGFALGVSYYSLSNHLVGDYLWLDNEFVELGFPKNWRAMAWVESEENIGSYYVQMAPPNVNTFSAVIIMVYDEIATQKYMDECNLTGIPSVLAFGANNLYEWALGNNANATINYVENGTTRVSSQDADYTTFVIENGYGSEEAFQNLSCTFISFMRNQRLVQIIFWGNEQDCLEAQGTFEAILDTVQVKT